MPRTLDEGFRDFLTNALTPSPGESAAAKGHRASIEECLRANFSLRQFFRTGSFGNGTSISNYSDVDYFATIPASNLTQNSATTLTKVRNALDARFPNTGVRVSCPAVLVPFGTLAKESTEVAPADYVGEVNGFKLYEIPDCSGRWMRSSPDAHNAYVRQIDERLGRKVKPLIRFIKAWKYFRNAPISSFYLELRVAKYAEGKSAIVYADDVRAVFAHLHRIGLAKMQDPMGVSGYVSACSTEAQLSDARSKLETALTRAQKACAAADVDNVKQAFEWWNLLYDGHFPSYYR